MNKAKHWQDPANAVLAVAVLVSPWAFGYTSSQPAMANAVIVGTLRFAASVGAAVVGRAWVDCGVAALAAWLVVAPWALELRSAVASSVAIGFGVVAFALALWSLLDSAFRDGSAGRSGQR